MNALWTPSDERRLASNLERFRRLAETRSGLPLGTYDALWEWSVSDLAGFWQAVWDFLSIRAHRPPDRIVDDATRMPGATWFAGAELNYAENLLSREGDAPAIAFRGEGRDDETWSWNRLRAEVARVAEELDRVGVVPGDRVAGFLPNVPETIAAMLAAASRGAVWSSCSPDFGSRGVLDRFGQIRPKVLLAADSYVYGGKRFDLRERLAEIVAELPSLERLVVLGDAAGLPRAVGWSELPPAAAPPSFRPLPFAHPLFIMYSSGTTGLPKCMVQSAGGVLLQHRKEHVLHVDLRPDDRIFYFTTCGWMMWNWLTSALASAATVVLFEGNPMVEGPGTLWRWADDARVDVFGTSARYLGALESADYRPRHHHRLSSLRTILSTGSPLSPAGFEYVYREVKADLHLASISGGTDLNGCFVLGSPLLPVHAGEIQCRGLGMKVDAWDESGRPVRDEKGELVCTAPFPSMPIAFWDDADGAKYRKAYFERFPGVWCHGDYIEITERGGIVIYGRSDATLNPGGVRIGTAEIYRVVESLPAIEDSLVIAQDWQDDVRVVLFVKLRSGATLDDALAAAIRGAIRGQLTPRHLPAKILAVRDIPYTISGKKVELAVRNVVHGRPVTNRDALKNPEALAEFANRAELAS